jgi:transcription antitermination factor NusG
VHDQLADRGFQVFLPKACEWSRRAGTRRLVSRPMFPGYLFLHHAIEKRSYIDIVSTRGVVRILGDRWDRLAPIADDEIAAIEQLAASDFASQPYPYLKEGQRARIMEGPLAGLEGVFVRSRRHRKLLVLSVDLLRRSVAVEIEGTLVEPITPATIHQRPALAACV